MLFRTLIKQRDKDTAYRITVMYGVRSDVLSELYPYEIVDSRWMLVGKYCKRISHLDSRFYSGDAYQFVEEFISLEQAEILGFMPWQGNV